MSVRCILGELDDESIHRDIAHDNYFPPRKSRGNANEYSKQICTLDAVGVAAQMHLKSK